MKNKQKIISLLFVALLLAGAVLCAVCPDRYYSVSEKRTLKQRPKFSFKALFSGDYTAAVEPYMADQFPGRDGWVTAKTLCDRMLGKKESGGVYFGSGGYLIAAHPTLKEKQGVTNLTALLALQNTCREEGVNLSVMLVPTADMILSDRLPAGAPCYDQSQVIAAAARGGLPVIDVTAALAAHSGEYIYYKTDHHWTSLGAYYAYAAWMRSRGEEPTPAGNYTKETLCGDFRGTSYNKVNYAFAPYDEIEGWYLKEEHLVTYNGGLSTDTSLYTRSFLSDTEKYGVFLNSNQAETVVYGGGEGNLLIIKDSYANTFAQFTADAFAQTHLIDLRFFTGSVKKYVAENGITDVLVLYNIPNFMIDVDLPLCAK